MVSTVSWVSESSTGGMFVGTIRLGLSNDVTWKGSPTGFPLTASKRMPHTLKKPSRPETKYIVFPSGDHRGLSSQCLPSVMRIHGPPVAAITYSVDSTCTGLVSQSFKDDPSTIGREVALIKVVRRAGSDFLRRRFCIRPGGHRQQPDVRVTGGAIFLRYQKPLAVTGPIVRISVRSAGCSEWFFGAALA